MFTYIVICREDVCEDGSKGRYSLATRHVFQDEKYAQVYASGISSSREAIVVPGNYNELRLPTSSE